MSDSGHYRYQSSFFLSDEEERDRLKQGLLEIGKIVKKRDVIDALEFIIGELANNAVQANLKRIFFTTEGYDFDDPVAYEAGSRAFIARFPSLNLAQYAKALELLKLQVEISIDINEKRLLLILKNKNAMSIVEEEVTRKYISEAVKNIDGNVLDLYLHYGDKTDGVYGLSLTMIVDFIRNAGFDADSFRVYNEGEFMKARLEFPLNLDGVSLHKEKTGP